MNIAAIKRNCLARRRAVILDALRGGQWVTNGTTAYLVEGMRMDIEALEALFNLPEKTRNNMVIAEKTTADPRFTYIKYTDEESTDEAGAMVYMGAVYIALPSRSGMLYIPLDEIKHIPEQSRYYSVRWWHDRPLVAVRGGMFCEALVMPLDNRSAEEMRSMAAKLAGPTYVWKDMESEAADAEAAAEALFKGENEASTDGDD